jgi:hypothetical protein
MQQWSAAELISSHKYIKTYKFSKTANKISTSRYLLYKIITLTAPANQLHFTHNNLTCIQSKWVSHGTKVRRPHSQEWTPGNPSKKSSTPTRPKCSKPVIPVKTRIWNAVLEAAKIGVEERVIFCIIMQESTGNVGVGTTTDNDIKPTGGLMQAEESPAFPGQHNLTQVCFFLEIN